MTLIPCYIAHYFYAHTHAHAFPLVSMKCDQHQLEMYHFLLSFWRFWQIKLHVSELHYLIASKVCPLTKHNNKSQTIVFPVFLLLKLPCLSFRNCLFWHTGTSNYITLTDRSQKKSSVEGLGTLTFNHFNSWLLVCISQRLTSNFNRLWKWSETFKLLNETKSDITWRSISCICIHLQAQETGSERQKWSTTNHCLSRLDPPVSRQASTKHSATAVAAYV